MTTSAEIIKPCIIGRMPDFLKLENAVFRPIAARALTIRNLLAVFVPETVSAGISKMLATIDIATKPSINQGKIFLILKFAFNPSAFWLFFCAYFFFMCS